MNNKKGCVFNIQRFSIHDGPGIRTAVFLKGCPLRCPWCSNPESQSSKPELIWDNQKKKEITTGEYYEVEEVMEVIRKDNDYYLESNGGVTVTGGEVLAQIDFAVRLLKQCKQENIHTACETSGYASEITFEKLIENVDLLIMDIKHYNSDSHQEITGVKLEPILKNLDFAISKSKEMLIRIPIIPGFNDTLEDAKKFGELLQKHKVKTVELLPFHQFGKSKYKFLNRTYKYENVKQFKTEDLMPHKEIMESFQINCQVA